MIKDNITHYNHNHDKLGRFAERLSGADFDGDTVLGASVGKINKLSNKNSKRKKRLEKINKKNENDAIKKSEYQEKLSKPRNQKNIRKLNKAEQKYLRAESKASRARIRQYKGKKLSSHDIKKIRTAERTRQTYLKYKNSKASQLQTKIKDIDLKRIKRDAKYARIEDKIRKDETKIKEIQEYINGSKKK